MTLQATGGATKTVVVADDTAFVRDRFQAALEQAGHRVVTARSAAELLARITAQLASVDLLLLDLRLSNSSGTDLVAAIRRLDTEGRLPILVFSGTIRSADEVRALSALGIAGYINEYSAATHIVPSVAPHLFPDSFNRRGSPRIVLGVPVQYRVGTSIAGALTLNLGHGGLAVRTTSPLAVGTRMHLRFRLPGTTYDLEAEGRVAWSDTRVGMGIQFDALESTAQRRIGSFVDAHFFSNRKP